MHHSGGGTIRLQLQEVVWVSPNCPPLASLRSPCPTGHRGLQYHPARHTPEVPPAALSPSQQSPLEKNPNVKSISERCNFFFLVCFLTTK